VSDWRAVDGPGRPMAPSRRGSRITRHALNALVAAISVACTYLIIEFVFFRILLPHVSLNLTTHLPDIAGVLVQNSKAGFVPHDYVALLGDSYAEGVGDWLLQAHGNRTKPFHSGNVIHEATGRDVVSFGRVGTGSAEAIVSRPARIYAGTDCYLFPSMEAPRDMFVYFYEGNDIEDNSAFVARVASHEGNASESSIDRFLVEDYASVSRWKCHTYLADTTVRMSKFLFQYYVEGVTFEADPRRENALVVAGQTVWAPPFHGPALRYSEDQIGAAVGVLGRSLAWLKRRFPGVPTTVVYIPSPASIYRFAGDTVVAGTGRQPGTAAPLALVARHSDLMCRLVRTEALNQGAGFLDTRPALRAAAQTRLIHGPVDWFHFNEAGYRALGKLVVDRLRGRPGVDSCSVAVH
jgi:hypothetical protein